MAFHQRVMEFPYEDTDEQRQAVWDAEMLLKDLNPLMRRLCLKIRNLRRTGKDVYLLRALERKRDVRKKIDDARAVLDWSFIHL